jgi:hypothetical protein
VRDDNTHIFDPSPLEFALLGSKIELVSPHPVQDQSSDMPMLIDIAGKDQNVIKIHRDDPLCDEIMEYLIHHGL